MTHDFSDQLLDELLANYEKPEDLLGSEGILKSLTKRLVERALAGEMTDHLGYVSERPEQRQLSQWVFVEEGFRQFWHDPDSSPTRLLRFV